MNHDLALVGKNKVALSYYDLSEDASEVALIEIAGSTHAAESAAATMMLVQGEDNTTIVPKKLNLVPGYPKILDRVSPRKRGPELFTGKSQLSMPFIQHEATQGPHLLTFFYDTVETKTITGEVK